MTGSNHSTYPVPELKCQVQVPEGVPVADQVVICYCDCCAAGVRVVQALADSQGASVSRHAVQLTGLDSSQPVLQSLTDPTTNTPVQLANISASPSSTQAQVSVLCINSVVKGRDTAHVVAALISWLQGHQQAVKAAGRQPPPVVVAAAAWLSSIRPKETDTLVLPISSASVPASLASTTTSLPPSTKLQDGFLATLTHCLYVTGIQSYCLLVPGHKPSIASGLSDSVGTVVSLAGALQRAGLLPSDSVTAEGVSGLVLLHKWYSETHGYDEIMYT